MYCVTKYLSPKFSKADTHPSCIHSLSQKRLLTKRPVGLTEAILQATRSVNRGAHFMVDPPNSSTFGR